MDYIEKKARQLVNQNFRPNGIGQNAISRIKSDLSEFSAVDKIKYVTIILEGNDKFYSEHLAVCQEGEYCGSSEKFEKMNYFLQQELRRLGVQMNDDTFTREEKSIIVEQLNKILTDLSELKNGQEILFEEIKELKQWFILGKKNWRQLAAGKIGEMVTSGIIAEATAKPLINVVTEGVNRLIGQ